MKRREFITLVGGAAAWPISALAQHQPIPVIGFLNSGSRNGFARLLDGFHQGLSETGFREGRNILVEYRWAEGEYDRLPALAADLVNLRVSVLVATGSVPSALAAKAATETIPVVFVASDALRVGLVTSLSRPTGNVTGISPLGYDLWAKKLEIAAELIPDASMIGVLVNPDAPNAERQLQDIRVAAQTLGRQILVVNASRAGEFDVAFETLLQRHVRVLLVPGDPFFNSRSHELITLTARYSIPAVFERNFATSGGLISYGPDLVDSYRLAGNYASRILAGARPGDLPVQQGTKVELVINLKTAKALGLEVPPTLLARADEVIE